MKIYEKAKRFHPVTGYQHLEWVHKENRCDYTGDVLNYANEQCYYNFDYTSHDPAWSKKEYEFSDKFDLELEEFMLGTYHFRTPGPGDDHVKAHAEALMIQEVMKGWKNPKSGWFQCFTFDTMCRHARIRTASRLIEKGTIKAEQLYHCHPV
jgi:hypothetical protein